MIVFIILSDLFLFLIFSFYLEESKTLKIILGYVISQNRYKVYVLILIYHLAHQYFPKISYGYLKLILEIRHQVLEISISHII